MTKQAADALHPSQEIPFFLAQLSAVPYAYCAPEAPTSGKGIYEASVPPRKIVWGATMGFSFGSGGSSPPVLGFGSKRGELLLEIATRI